MRVRVCNLCGLFGHQHMYQTGHMQISLPRRQHLSPSAGVAARAPNRWRQHLPECLHACARRPFVWCLEHDSASTDQQRASQHSGDDVRVAVTRARLQHLSSAGGSLTHAVKYACLHCASYTSMCVSVFECLQFMQGMRSQVIRGMRSHQ